MDASSGCLRAQDVAPHECVGPFEFGNETATDLVAHSIVEPHEVSRCSVAGQQDASTRIEYVLNGMKEFELGLGAPAEELDIFDDEHPDRTAIAPLPIFGVSQSHRRHELTRKLLRRRVHDSRRLLARGTRCKCLCLVWVLSVVLSVPPRFSRGRAREMGLAHARIATEIELVEAALSPSSKRQGCFAGEGVAGSDNKALEAERQLLLAGSVLGIESRVVSGVASGSARVMGSRSRVAAGCSRSLSTLRFGDCMKVEGCGFIRCRDQRLCSRSRRSIVTRDETRSTRPGLQGSSACCCGQCDTVGRLGARRKGVRGDIAHRHRRRCLHGSFVLDRLPELDRQPTCRTELFHAEQFDRALVRLHRPRVGTSGVPAIADHVGVVIANTIAMK